MKQICKMNFKLFFGVLLLLSISACQSSWLNQRYKQLNKIAVTAKSESDSVRKHIEKYLNEVSSRQILTQDSSVGFALVSAETQPENFSNRSPVSAIYHYAKEESMRLVQKFPVANTDYRSVGKMAVNDTKIWWLWGVFLFIAAFMLAVAIIRWVSKSDSGCLVIGSWILLTFALVYLLIALIG